MSWEYVSRVKKGHKWVKVGHKKVDVMSKGSIILITGLLLLKPREWVSRASYIPNSSPPATLRGPFNIESVRVGKLTF
jgi:hypothetical protein